MKIVKAKIRGLGTTMETDWIDLSPRLNLFHFSEQTAGSNFLRALQTINPPYSCQAVRPFSDFPNVSKHRGYLQRISPQKRTVAMAVFGATPALVSELADSSDLLYETDRIEVGRRLDYSRWINFVELASSTRWSEIAPDIAYLLDHTGRLAPHLADELHSIADGSSPSDRIKRGLKNDLVHWLNTARKELGAEFEQRIETTRKAAMRADYFQAARATVYQRLPMFAVCGNSPLSQSVDDLLQYLGTQVQLIGDDGAASNNTLAHRLNHEISLVNICEPPLRIDCTGTTFGLRDQRISTQHSDSGTTRGMLRAIERAICLAIALSRTVYRTEPILLFDAPDNFLDKEIHPELVKLVCTIAETCQCLYASPGIEIFPDNCGRVFKASEIIAGNRKNRSPAAMMMDGMM